MIARPSVVPLCARQEMAALHQGLREGWPEPTTSTWNEPGSTEARARFLEDHAPEAAELHAKELKRREKKASKVDDDQASLDLGKADAPDDEATA